MARGYKDYRQVTTAEEPEGKWGVHGTVKMYDDFEDTPIKWQTVANDVHGEMRTPDAAYNGSYGLEFCARKVEEASAWNTQIRYPPIGERRTLELSLYWRISQISANAAFEWWIMLYEHERYVRGAIRFLYDTITPHITWQYNTPAGWIDLQGNEGITVNAWNEIALAADFANGTYLYARSNDQVFKLCNQPLLDDATGTAEYNMIAMTVREYAGFLTCIDIDDVLLQEL